MGVIPSGRTKITNETFVAKYRFTQALDEKNSYEIKRSDHRMRQINRGYKSCTPELSSSGFRLWSRGLRKTSKNQERTFRQCH